MGTFDTSAFIIYSLDNVGKKKMRAFALLASALSLVSLASGKLWQLKHLIVVVKTNF